MFPAGSSVHMDREEMGWSYSKAKVVGRKRSRKQRELRGSRRDDTDVAKLDFFRVPLQQPATCMAPIPQREKLLIKY